MTSPEQPARRMLGGQCQCGAVHYAVADEFVYAANCHCANCRRATGSAFKPFAGIARDKLRITGGADHLMIFGDDNRPRRALPGVRFAALFGGARRRLRPRRHGHPGRRPGHPPEQAHLRRLEGAVVHHHRRSAAIRRACGGRRIRAARHRDGRCLTPARPSGARDHSSSADASRTPARQRGAESSATEACDA